MRKAVRVGPRYVTWWTLPDGSTIETPMTQGQYRALARRGAGAPARPSGLPASAVWDQSMETVQYDTPSGVLGVEDYDDDDPETLWVGTPDGVIAFEWRSQDERTTAMTTLTLPRDLIHERGARYRMVNGQLSRVT